MDFVNERTTANVTVAFQDANGAPATPASVTYSTQCVTTGVPIKNNQNVVGPASTITIVLDALDNAIQNQANPQEIKRLTVRAVYNTNDECNSEYVYAVNNLAGV